MIIRDMRKSREVPFIDVEDYSHFHTVGDELTIYQKVPVFFNAACVKNPKINAININKGFLSFSDDSDVISVELEVLVVK